MIKIRFGSKVTIEEAAFEDMKICPGAPRNLAASGMRNLLNALKFNRRFSKCMQETSIPEDAPMWVKDKLAVKNGTYHSIALPLDENFALSAEWYRSRFGMKVHIFEISVLHYVIED